MAASLIGVCAKALNKLILILPTDYKTTAHALV
jgi:hypothetical protein